MLYRLTFVFSVVFLPDRSYNVIIVYISLQFFFNINLFQFKLLPLSDVCENVLLLLASNVFTKYNVRGDGTIYIGSLNRNL